MKASDQKIINNLKLRYRDYDLTGKKYFFDIVYTTLSSPGAISKADRETGADRFSEHIDHLTKNYEDVTTIVVTDYKGTGNRAKQLNPPVTIEFIDQKSVENTPRYITTTRQPQSEPSPVFAGLSGLFAGTQYEGLGQLAPVVKFLDDKHSIERLTEKLEEQKQSIARYEREKQELTTKLEALQTRCNELEDEADELGDELEDYRVTEKKKQGIADMAGAALLSGAKFFLRQHPGILNGIIPAETLAGILNGEPEPEPEPQPASRMSDDDQERIDDATVIFDWLQTLHPVHFEQVATIFAAIRQNPDYAAIILNFLNGKSKQLIKTQDNDNS